MAVAFFCGGGLVADEAKREAFQKSLELAKKGDAFNQYIVGSMYLKPLQGYGIIQDYNEARKWLSKAAYQENGDGQLMFGYMFSFGNGVDKDLVKGYAWNLLANASGVHGEVDIGKIIKKVEDILSDEQKAEGLKMARELQKEIEKNKKEKKEAKTEEDK